MERVFIDREWSIAYAVLAIDSIYNSANRERTIDELIEEIKTMFDVHQDEQVLMNLKKLFCQRKEITKLKLSNQEKRAR